MKFASENNSNNSMELPIPIQEIAFLQAYLYGVFTSDNKYNKNFNHTEWYLNAKYKDDEVTSIKTYFRNNGIECDCDIINKFDIRDISKGLIKTHDFK